MNTHEVDICCLFFFFLPSRWLSFNIILIIYLIIIFGNFGSILLLVINVVYSLRIYFRKIKKRTFLVLCSFYTMRIQKLKISSLDVMKTHEVDICCLFFFSSLLFLLSFDFDIILITHLIIVFSKYQVQYYHWL